MLYWIQVNIYAALMCLVYIAVLRNRQMHSFNRFYLLSAVVLPLLLPFMRFPATIGERLRDATALHISLPEFVAGAAAKETVWNITSVLWLVYAIVAVVLLSVTIYRVMAIRSVVRKHRHEERDGYTLVPGTGFGPGSWHTYIFLPGEEENTTVINHELAHIQLRHTRDIMLLHIIQAFFWPNILLVWIKKELMQVHEFQADAATGMETGAYAELLVSNIFGRCTLPATHSFIIHPIKRRIMMLKRNSNKMQRFAMGTIAIIIVSTLAGIGLGIQSCTTKKWDVKQEQGAGAVLKTAEQMPEFPGDMNAFMAQNITYPESARAKEIQGKVFLKFVVDKDGSIINKQVVKSPDEKLSQAAMDMLDKMPKWIPGEDHGQKVAVEFVLPVWFKL